MITFYFILTKFRELKHFEGLVHLTSSIYQGIFYSCCPLNDCVDCQLVNDQQFDSVQITVSLLI